jgi:DNA adenine methylase
MQLKLKIENDFVKTQPFLRWAGGKKWLLKYLPKYLPEKINNYYEPFLGGGSIYFNLNDKLNRAYLSDVNEELINTYIAIRDDVESVIKELKRYKNTKDFYYKIRALRFDELSRSAARFIYLNKTSFNGIYRVNKNGIYNVPYGNRVNADFVNEEGLRCASTSLKNATLLCRDFEITCRKAKEGDLVFIDPPYTVAHENNGFISYNQKLFTLQDQVRLAEAVQRLGDRGVFYILTNAKHQTIRDIYNKIGKPIEIQRSSNIGGREAFRGLISEYLYTNSLTK